MLTVKVPTSAIALVRVIFKSAASAIALAKSVAIWQYNTIIQYNKQTPHVFCELPGPKHIPSGDTKPIDFFNLFFTAALIKTMVVETNRYAAQFLQDHPNLKPHSRAKLWKPVTIPEMRGFIAVILEMGITKRPTIFSYWTKDSRCIPWFGRMFPRNRFQLLLKFFHLVDNKTLALPGHPAYDPCARFQVLVDHANLVFRQHYIPNQQLSIDESLVGTNAHTVIKQYLPNKKHHKWGIKFWMLCDSVSKYCLGFFCYRGAKSEVVRRGFMEFVRKTTHVNFLFDSSFCFNYGSQYIFPNFYLCFISLVQVFIKETPKKLLELDNFWKRYSFF